MKKITLSGNILFSDVKNLNGRIYTKECVLEIAEKAQIEVQQGNLLGEFGFSERPEVNLGNVSHRVVEVHYDPIQDSLEGTIEILDTPKGRMVKNLFESVGKESFCIRSRGTGTINEKGEVENYQLYSFDIIPADQDPYKDIEHLRAISKDPLEGLK